MISSLQRDDWKAIAFRYQITWKRVMLHALFWPLLFVGTLSQFRRVFRDKPNEELLYVVNTHHFLTVIVSFGILSYVLIPCILYKERPSSERLLLTALMLIGYYGFLCFNTYGLLMMLQAHYASLPDYLSHRVTQFMQAKWYEYLFAPTILFFIFGQFASYVLIALLCKVLREVYSQRKTRFSLEKERQKLAWDNLVLEKENATKDLQFLRQQINPHFLLNAFNNIYSLILRRDERAAETLASLSTLMRYALYRTSNEFVPLRDELLFLRGYVDMEQIRHRQPDTIICSLPEPTEAAEEWLVPPLLLVTFVENAFKHGLNAVYEGGWVTISLTTELDQTDRLIFTVANNKGGIPAYSTKDGGIGLANVKRRLALLYPSEQYELILQDELDQFYVRLTIPLNKTSETLLTHEYVPTLFTDR